MRQSLLRLALPSLLLGGTLAGCGTPETVVTLTVNGAPVRGQEVVILPYDRDSILSALAAQATTPQPDPAPLVALLDSLRQAYAVMTAAPAGDAKARRVLEARRAQLEPRVEVLRAAQHQWRDATYQGYDSITYAFTRRLARDPFTDTTESDGAVTLRPPHNGHWWVTVRAWDAADPFSEWYWNLPLAGDSLHLTTANAQRRPRI
jgi:hypothetical protein